MGKYYLFGSGSYAKSLLELIKKDDVIAFVDNNPDICGYDEKFEKEIIRAKDFWSEYNSEIIIVAVSGRFEREIENQLIEKNIHNYVLLTDLIKMMNDKLDKRDISDALSDLYNNILVNSNKRSQIEFYLVDSFEIFHYLPLYHELLKRGIDAEIIAEPIIFNSAGSWFDYYRAIDILEKIGIRYRKFRNSNAMVAVTTQYYDNLKFYCYQKVQMSYGVALLKEKAFQLDSDVIRKFDALLVHGKCQEDILREKGFSKTIIRMSYPKFLRGGNCQKVVNVDKPVLLYMPTWDEYSSINEYVDVIGKLRRKYYIVAKPHHCTEKLPQKKGEMELLRKNCDLLLDSDYNLFELAHSTDVLLCDGKSAVAYEMLFINIQLKLVLILNKGLKKEDYYIDVSSVGTMVSNYEELYSVLNNNVNHGSQKEKIKTIDYLFDRNIKKGIDNATEQIISIIKSS